MNILMQTCPYTGLSKFDANVSIFGPIPRLCVHIRVLLTIACPYSGVGCNEVCISRLIPRLCVHIRSINRNGCPYSGVVDDCVFIFGVLIAMGMYIRSINRNGYVCINRNGYSYSGY